MPPKSAAKATPKKQELASADVPAPSAPRIQIGVGIDAVLQRTDVSNNVAEIDLTLLFHWSPTNASPPPSLKINSGSLERIDFEKEVGGPAPMESLEFNHLARDVAALTKTGRAAFWRLKGTDIILARQGFSLLVNNHFNLSRFPFDQQVVRLEGDLVNTKMEFVPWSDRFGGDIVLDQIRGVAFVRAGLGRANDEWELDGFHAELPSPTSFSVNYRLVRRTSRYVSFGLLLPFLLTLMSWGSYGIATFGERAVFLAIILLACVASKILLTLQLPRVPYMTFLDTFYATCFLTIHGVFVKDFTLSVLRQTLDNGLYTDYLRYSQDINICIAGSGAWTAAGTAMLAAAGMGSYLSSWSDIEKQNAPPPVWMRQHRAGEFGEITATLWDKPRAGALGVEAQICLEKNDDPKSALSCLLSSLKDSPGPYWHPKASLCYLKLAEIARVKGDKQEDQDKLLQQAMDHAKIAVELAPEWDIAHWQLGDIFEAKDRVDEARAAWTRALELRGGQHTLLEAKIAGTGPGSFYRPQASVHQGGGPAAVVNAPS